MARFCALGAHRDIVDSIENPSTDIAEHRRGVLHKPAGSSVNLSVQVLREWCLGHTINYDLGTPRHRLGEFKTKLFRVRKGARVHRFAR